MSAFVHLLRACTVAAATAAALTVVVVAGAPRAANLSDNEIVFAAADGPVSLNALPTRVELGTAGEHGVDSTLAARLHGLAAGHKIYLVLRGLAANAPPGVLFHVYLDLPTGEAKTAKDDAHYVGSFNLFNEAAAQNDALRHSFRTYDITEIVRKLQARHLLTETTTVTILASHAPEEGAKATIARIELVER